MTSPETYFIVFNIAEEADPGALLKTRLAPGSFSPYISGENRMADPGTQEQEDVYDIMSGFTMVEMIPYFRLSGIPFDAIAGNKYEFKVEALGADSEVNEEYKGTVALSCAQGRTIFPEEEYTFTDEDNGVCVFQGIVFEDIGEPYITYIEVEDAEIKMTGRTGDIAVSPPDFITGMVTQKKGRPVTGVKIKALRDGKAVEYALTDTEGKYRISGLQPGTYTVRASWKAEGIISTVEAQAKNGTSDFIFTLEVEYELGEIIGKLEIDGKGVFASESISTQRALAAENAHSDTAYIQLRQSDGIKAQVPVKNDGSFSIPNLLPGKYTARAYNGRSWSNTETLTLSEGQVMNVSFTFSLDIKNFYCYPNPSRPEHDNITIRYESGAEHEGSLGIYTLSGNLVREFRLDENAGSTYVEWDKKNESGRRVASGVYFIVLRADNSTKNESKVKMIKAAVIR